MLKGKINTVKMQTKFSNACHCRFRTPAKLTSHEVHVNAVSTPHEFVWPILKC